MMQMLPKKTQVDRPGTLFAKVNNTVITCTFSYFEITFPSRSRATKSQLEILVAKQCSFAEPRFVFTQCGFHTSAYVNFIRKIFTA